MNAYALYFEGRRLARFGAGRLRPRRTIQFLVDLPEGDTHLALGEIDSIRVIEAFDAPALLPEILAH